MKNSLLIGIIVVLGLAVLLLLGRDTTQSQAPGAPALSGPIGSLIAPEKFYDFGNISMKNGLVEHVFKVSNTSGQDVFVKKLTTSCMCTAAFIQGAGGEKGPFGMEGMGYVPPADETIKAGESRDIKVVYDPNAHGPAGIGRIDRFIYLADASGTRLTFEIKAMVTP